MSIGSGWRKQAEPDEEWLDNAQSDPESEHEDSQGGSTLVLAPGRSLVLISFFAIALTALAVRLVYWTLFPSSSQAIHAAAVPSEPMRGRILDRNGILLATDTFVGEVYARPAAIHDDTRRGPTVMMSTTLALGQAVETLQAAMAVTTPVAILSKQATVDQCDSIAAMGAPGMVWCDYSRQRAYPQGTVASHVLGFLNYQHEGLYGVEARYDNWLNRESQWPGSLPAASGPVPAPWQLYLPSPAGRDLVLNLDAPLQYMVEKRLQEAINHYQAEAGIIIIMDPRTGAVLAMANSPTFDPGQYSAVDPNTWVNSATSEIYEPGSVFKLITIAAGLDSGYITPESTFIDEGALTIAGRTIRNAEKKSYGGVTISEVLAHSINVVSAKVSLRMGAESFYNYIRGFGFGNLTEVDLQSEVRGIVKQPNKGNDWSPFDLATNSFGQGISVTAFQMTNAVAAIANGGLLLQPQVVQAMVDNGDVHPIPPRVLGRPIRPETSLALTQMMVYTVASSSQSDLVPGYTVAGKTGTAEIPTKEGYTSQQSIMSFAGFLPAADPQLVILVKIVKPRIGIWAEQVATPVFSQVGQDAVRILEIRPDNRKP